MYKKDSRGYTLLGRNPLTLQRGGSVSKSVLVERPFRNNTRAQELSKKLQRYSQDYLWIQENYKNLAREHPNSYIAVKDKEVVFTAPTMEELVLQIEAAGEDVVEYIAEYVTTEETTFIFLWLKKLIF